MKRYLVSLTFFSMGLLTTPAHATGIEPCLGLREALVVDTISHVLWICQNDVILKGYEVSLGRGGVDKRREGDRKTPLGIYKLGTPRMSDQFGIFIPVKYPTLLQRLQGFTGSKIGIHGPRRKYKELGIVNTWVDWTQGCIALATDEAISDVARWIRELNVTRVVIR